MSPRVLRFVTAKRNAPLTARSYGHWWIEVDDDESYGWWPSRPLGPLSFWRSVPGVLNGLGVCDAATCSRDPSHGLPADYEFHPVLITDATDDDVRHRIRQFALSFEGEWRWSTQPTVNCRTFQLALFDHVGLVDGTGNYLSRGGGCPALAPVRRVSGRVIGRRLWPRNLPPPGARVPASLLGGAARCPSERTGGGGVTTTWQET